jgi:hypothetical protein
MKDNKKIKPLSVSAQLNQAEANGAKVAKIMNEAREKANKILKESGHYVNINVDFCKIDDNNNDANN